MEPEFPEPSVWNDNRETDASPSRAEHVGQQVVTNRVICALWGPSLSLALTAASVFYAAEESEPSLKDTEEAIATRFWQVLTHHFPHRPERDEVACRALLWAVWRVLREVRTAPTMPFVEDQLSVALRPVRRLRAGLLTAEVCAALYDFDRGVWTPHLTKPQMWTIQCALAETIAALPPEEMQSFWENLQSSDPRIRQAMRLGLTFLRSAHAVPHLIRGLEAVPDHHTRAAILDCLEEIGDPRALAALHRLRRETARTDWTLSRHLARAISAIERQNRGNQHRTLLRPTEPPGDPEAVLLRPAADAPDTASRRAAEERASLLRSVRPPDLPDDANPTV